MFLNSTLSLYAFVLACGTCHAMFLAPVLEGRTIYLGLCEILSPGSQFLVSAELLLRRKCLGMGAMGKFPKIKLPIVSFYIIPQF